LEKENSSVYDLHSEKSNVLVVGLFLLLPLGAQGIREKLRFTSVS
jgi:hypothetical protein